tara:strand:+ start:413 stop:607 length:195 start_codon:yes stop_codon:yes gene_type:complete
MVIEQFCLMIRHANGKSTPMKGHLQLKDLFDTYELAEQEREKITEAFSHTKLDIAKLEVREVSL